MRPTWTGDEEIMNGRCSQRLDDHLGVSAGERSEVIGVAGEDDPAAEPPAVGTMTASANSSSE